MDSYKLFIDGKFVDAQDGKTFTTIDPGSGVAIANVAKAGHPMMLRDIGIKEEPRHEAAFHAVCDPVQIFNARPVNNLGEVIKLFKQVY
jgi:hypothetical protein